MGNTSAVDELSKLVQDGVTPQGLDARYDLLKLIGMVIGQMTLLGIVTDSKAKAEARVAAARALINIKESPESIAERLRRSPFANLTVDQLHSIVQGIKDGDADIKSLVEKQQKEITRSPDSKE